MSKKINQLDAVPDSSANDNSFLFPLCDPVTGIAGKMTVQQAKAVFATKSLQYRADGTEGSLLVIPAIAGKYIISIHRGSGLIYPVNSAPESDEFAFDLTTITLGAPVGGAGEKFLIQYRNG